MELATRRAAEQLGMSQRQVQRLAESGRVVSRSIAGRTVVASRSLVALTRANGRGRRWDERTVAAAAELLETGNTDNIVGSQRSRLRARLREMDVSELAYHVLGDRGSFWRGAQTEARTDGLSATGASITVTITDDAHATARRNRLLEDPDGTLVLIELATGAATVIEDLALYAYGDARTSSAARERIEARLRAMR